MKYLLLLLLFPACSNMQNKEGDLKKNNDIEYRVQHSFGEVVVKPAHKQWKGYPFLSYEARFEFLKSVAMAELKEACPRDSIKVNVEAQAMEYPKSYFFSPGNPSGIIVTYTCKLKTPTE